MKINKIQQVEKLLETVNLCKEGVYLKSNDGDCFNLKSELSKYVALGALIQNADDQLELFCDSKDDEAIFLKFFQDNPEVL